MPKEQVKVLVLRRTILYISHCKMMTGSDDFRARGI
jgi:hypothetical protein